MKALSYIVASILMLIITVALSGTAYLYMSGILTGSMQGIEIADAFCSLGEVTISIRNIGTSSITKLDIEQTNPKDDFLTPSFQGTIEPGKTIQYKDTCEGETARKCMYRIIPPAGKTIVADVTCTGTPESLVLSLHFDEGFGLATKDSGRNNNGIFYGGNFNDGTINGANRISGKYGKALSFVDGSQYVNIPDNSILNFGTSDFTIMGWVNITQPLPFGSGIFGNYPHAGQIGDLVIGIADDTTSLFLAHLNTNNQAFTHLYDFSPYFGKWTHIAWIKEGSRDSYLYINGDLKQSYTAPADYIVDFQPDGYYISSTGWWPGIMPMQVDEHRIYNRALTPAEIRAEMQSSIPISRPVASYSFEDTDMSGYANDTHIWVKGKYGSALSFDGSDDEVRGVFPLNMDQFTISLWAYPIGLQTQIPFALINWVETIVFRDNPTFEAYIGGRDCVTGGGVTQSFGIPTSDFMNKWNHIIVSYNGATVRFYWNGTLQKEASWKTCPASIPTDYSTKSIWGGCCNFNGIIDEVRIYNKALL